MIIDLRKFITKWSLYGMSSFHFYRWNQFKVIPLACRLRARNLYPKFSAPSNASWRRVHDIMQTSVSRGQPMTIQYWLTWHYAASIAGSKPSRILYCGHSTQYSHLVKILSSRFRSKVTVVIINVAFVVLLHPLFHTEHDRNNTVLLTPTTKAARRSFLVKKSINSLSLRLLEMFLILIHQKM